MNTLRCLVVAAALTVAPGCAGFMSTLPTIVAYVQDAQLVVSAIESFVNAYFQVAPNPGRQKDVGIAIARTKAALSAVVRSGAGVDKLNQADIDAAFVEFRLAYTDLVNLVRPLGVTTEGQALKATPTGGLVVPEPLMIKRPL